VRSTTSSDPAPAPTALDEVQARELNAVAAILESLAVRLAPPFDGGRRARLRAANARLRAARGPVAAAIADREFHRRLVETCPDDALLATLRPVHEALQTPAARGTGGPQRHAAEHDRVIDALAAGDNVRAAERLRAHIAARLPALLAAVRAATGRAPVPSA
jgi:DNA-binding GntR family transcriptional regulator